MKVQHGEEVANHSDPESCGAYREVCVEALTGETGRRRNDGGFKIVRLAILKPMRTTLAAIRETLMRRRYEPVAVVGRWLRKVLQGYLNYHAVPDNLRRLGGFCWEVGRAWRHALMRRSQRHRLS